MTTPVNLQNVSRIVTDLGELAAHDVPAVGSLPTATENAATAMRWLWGISEIGDADLRTARKVFAKRHHPDISNNCGHMAIANQLIDQSIEEAAA